ncbi:potassium channel family protein [Rhodohalobacter sp. 614A]|uniref:potassium channel family protein n=1 Tax=Rhodohalobacter sp. 614A TaxID=2908649 RepID=UPI001F28E1CB|nr:potassium channel family protein [Rhodohalobacter sp. 614A]
MVDKKSSISYEDFIYKKNRLYRFLKNGSKEVEYLKSQANDLLEEVRYIYKDEGISDLQWVVNVSEFREFYNGLEFNYDRAKTGGYRIHDKRIPYRNHIYKMDYKLWDRLYRNGVYSIYDCELEIDDYHLRNIAYYNFLYHYSNTGLFQLRPLGILSYHFENTSQVKSYDDCISLASRYLNAYHTLKKYEYDLKHSKYSDKLKIRRELIEGAIKTYKYAYDRAFEAKDNRLQSIFYFHIMKSKELLKKENIHYYISKSGNYARIKNRYDSKFSQYLSEYIFGQTDYFINILKYLGLKLLRLLCGYGERPQNVIISGALTVLFFSPLFMINGIRVNEKVIDYTLDVTSFPTINYEYLSDIGNSLYFSMITFTTLGYGDASPIGLSKLFASLESFFGAIFISLFIFTLARQVQR